ncbi:hypothetical protein KEM48_000311 [Puccinia striiformis f. sp. tritici PST-130]|nr:hypothetical protein KEM48_000311 [Puccinia striiformis f. sp. tritici PST-130]
MTNSTIRSAKTNTQQQPPIWWTNLIFVIRVGPSDRNLWGIFISPIDKISSTTLIMAILSWQLATFGITIGYHRLWSHKSFKASTPLKWFLSLIGCLGFQGSIKWWVLRHRLHHRWTDSEFDPYNSKNGLFFSHMGWIFRKPKYEKLKLIDQSDLNQDPVVRFQHKYYVSLSLFMGFILPYLSSEYILRSNRHSRLDGLIWAGFISRILIWHFTFLINSFAHYYGERHFDLDISARSNFILALFTGGEANHNYHHVFPKDYRNGPDNLDWDPSKWIIYLLHQYTNLVPKINYTDSSELEQVRQRVLKITSSKRKDGRPSKFEDIHHISLLSSSSSSSSSSDLELENDQTKNITRRTDPRTTKLKSTIPRWKRDEMLMKLIDYHQSLRTSTPVDEQIQSLSEPVKRPKDLRILVIDNYLVDVTQYFRSANHPGGNRILERYQLDLSYLNELEGLINHLKNPQDILHNQLFNPFTDFEEFKSRIGFIDCSHEFTFDINTHSSFAWIKMKSLRIARLIN